MFTTNNTKNIEITALYRQTNYVFQDGTPDRCIIGTANIDNPQMAIEITIKGNCQPNELQQNTYYRFFGQWKTHKKYGKQFLFTSFCESVILSRNGIVTYLQNCHGIGKKRAEQIYELFGNESMEAIKKQDIKLFSIKGLTNSIVENAAQKLNNQASTESITIELHDLLDGSGMPKWLRSKLVIDYGTNVANIIRETPYILMKYPGVGFNLADELYKKLGLPLNAPNRQGYFLWNMIYRDSSGSVWISRTQLERRFKKEIGNGADFQTALEFGNENDFYSLSCQEHYIADSENAYIESKIAKKIGKILQNNDVRWSNFTLGDDLTQHQIQELQKATRKKIGILSGAPGTGKTFTLARLINLIGTKNVLVCAPTGKAAVRITQTLHDYKIQLVAKTIHSTLGCIRSGNTFQFEHDENNPFDEEFVIVDESSMIDNSLFYSLIRAIDSHTHLLLVGDPDQLPPVGIGAPLRDLIAADIPNGHLTEIIRNEGQIVSACHAIRQKQRFALIQNCLATPEKNLVNINEITTIEKTLQTIIGNNAASDIQLIVAVNQKTKFCLENINTTAKKIFNPAAFTTGTLGDITDESAGKRIDINDKVICNKNGYLETLTTDNRESETIYVANGDIGTVQSMGADGMIVQLDKATVLVPITAEEGKLSKNNFNLAYAITAHRSQGSEWKTVVIFLDDSFNANAICDQHWLYTAISRAKKNCYLIGDMKTAYIMIGKSNMWLRKTFLVEEIQNSQWNDFVANFKNTL